ncbi:MAG: hypothetical protein RBJ76_05870 [Stenomitos frigidus ULC029]
MKLATLKEKTYRTWLLDFLIEDPETPIQTACIDLAFKSVVRDRFGDLRRRDTWEAAFVSLKAQSMYSHNSHSQYLIERSFIESPQKEGYSEYIPQILDAFLQIKGGMSCLVTGLQYALKNGLALTTKPAVLNFLKLGYQVAKRLELEQAFSSAMSESMPLLTASVA